MQSARKATEPNLAGEPSPFVPQGAPEPPGSPVMRCPPPEGQGDAALEWQRSESGAARAARLAAQMLWERQVSTSAIQVNGIALTFCKQQKLDAG